MTQTTTPSTPPTDPSGLSARLRAVWSLGDYATVAAEVIPSLGRTLVDATSVRPGDDVLDVGAGSGNAAIPAALAGGHVVASDVTPELFDAGRRAATEAGTSLTWEEADAADLPHPDASFDVVLSCVGAMFAPFHQPVADEIVRVTRPGGRIGLLGWTPDGFIGRMFAAMRPFAPPPPAGAQPPPLWGREDHVRELLGDRVDVEAARTDRLVVDRFADARELVTFFRQHYGPTIAVFTALGDDEARVRELDDALLVLADAFGAATGRMEWEYLLLTAVRR